MKLKKKLKIKEIPITYKNPIKSRYSALIIEKPITGDIGNEIDSVKNYFNSLRL